MKEAYLLFSLQENYVLHIKALNQALHLGFTLEKSHKVNRFNQKDMNMNTKLRKEVKNDLGNSFFLN